MSILTDVLDSLGLLYVPEEAKNVLFWPPPTPAPTASWHPRLVEGVLAHPTGDLTRDNALRPRVSVMLGPGATLAGVATLLADLLDDITDRTTAAPLPSAHEVLEALLTYSATHLTNTPTDRLVVGFRMPLPGRDRRGRRNLGDQPRDDPGLAPTGIRPVEERPGHRRRPTAHRRSGRGTQPGHR
jgi:hypothetical protein